MIPSYRYVVSSPEQFKIDDIFDCMTAVTISKPQQIVSQSYIDNIVLPERAEIFFSFDVKAFDFIEEIAFKQCADISLNRMCARRAFPFTILKKAFIH